MILFIWDVKSGQKCKSSVGTESRLMVARHCEKNKWGMPAKGIRFLLVWVKMF